MPPSNPIASSLSADDIIRLLDLAPHPEGGHFRETFRDTVTDDYWPARLHRQHFLLGAGEVSRWRPVRHRRGLDQGAAHAGAAAGACDCRRGPAGALSGWAPISSPAGEHPQAVVPAGAWQQATSLGSWSLVSCMVAPGFRFAGFEVAPPGLDPQ